ncbi:MAG: carotenoid biosynthesis protein [Candidatus Nanopelagicales bacterium]
MSRIDVATDRSFRTPKRVTVALIPQIGVAVTIGLQICWPLTSGETLAHLTVLTVLVFAATSVTHAWIHRGARWALQYAVITTVFAFLLEWLGVSTGFPFTSYSYNDELGLRVLEVPLIIPIAWTMAAYPALLLARTLAARARWNPLTASAVGAVAMTAWDIFLDPQMVAAGYWTWVQAFWSLPGVPGIPAINFAGWLVGSFVLMLLLSSLRDDRAADGLPTAQGVPAVLWAWMWIGGIVANAFFFGRPSVALVGGLAMAIVSVPYFLKLSQVRGGRRNPVQT